MSTGPYDDTFREDLAAYALGALTPPERVRMEAHVRECPICAAELEELSETAAALALDAPPIEPPHRVRAGLMARLNAEMGVGRATSSAGENVSFRRDADMPRGPFAPSTSLRDRVLRWPLRYTAAAAAVAGMFAVSATVVMVTTNQIDERVDEIERQVAAEGTAMTEMVKTVEKKVSAQPTTSPQLVSKQSVQVQATSESDLLSFNEELERIYKMLRDQLELDQLQAKETTKTIALRGQGPAEDAIGTLVTGHENDATGVLVVYGLPPAAPDHQYQFWLEYRGRYVSVGSFQVGRDGYAHIRVPLPEGGIEYLRGGVTMEPAGGSRVPTGTQVLNVAP